MTHETFADERIPTWALASLLGEESYLEPDEEAQVKRYHDAWVEEFPGSDIVYGYDADADPYFTHGPEFGLACDVYDVTVTVIKRDPS